MSVHAYDLLARGVTTAPSSGGTITKPASGATITLWTSADNQNSTNGGRRYKRLALSLYSSHASGASGVSFEESIDGSNWRTLVQYTLSATTYTKYYVAVSAPFVRVRYTNSANTLTTWEMSLFGDEDERGNV